MGLSNDRIWVVVRRSPDCGPKMVEILGVFSTREEARTMREEVWDRRRIVSDVEQYRVQGYDVEQCRGQG